MLIEELNLINGRVYRNAGTYSCPQWSKMPRDLIDQRFLTETVYRIVQRIVQPPKDLSWMYDGTAKALADALEEAGCQDESILIELRSQRGESIAHVIVVILQSMKLVKAIPYPA